MPFVKGDSRINRDGRPKGSGLSITTEIKKKLQQIPEGQKKSYLELLIDRILKGAIVDGDSKLIDRVWNYIDGMPKQNIGLSADEDIKEIKVTIKNNDGDTSDKSIQEKL